MCECEGRGELVHAFSNTSVWIYCFTYVCVGKRDREVALINTLHVCSKVSPKSCINKYLFVCVERGKRVLARSNTTYVYVWGEGRPSACSHSYDVCVGRADLCHDQIKLIEC